MRFFAKSPKPFLDAEDEAWIIETFAWLNANIASPRWLPARPTILPTAAFFPPTELQGHARAAHIFDSVRAHMGMSAWECQLVSQTPRSGLALPGIPFHALTSQTGAAGTFGMDGNAAIITYDPAELAHPMRLIAIFAHELSHYRLASVPELPPGGSDLAEPVTDLTALAFDFGIFGANSAFDHEQHQDYQSIGWKTRRLGYIPERFWIFGLAALSLHTATHLDSFEPYLKPHLRADLRTAARSLQNRPALLAQL